jgi:hypothetical protein
MAPGGGISVTVPDEPTAADQAWLVTPPDPHEVSIHVEAAEVSETVRDALEAFMHDLFLGDVEGRRAACNPECPSLAQCESYQCMPYKKCTVLTGKQCLVDMTCRIAP